MKPVACDDTSKDERESSVARDEDRRYRVFVSYAHKNLDLAQIVVKRLSDFAIPMWDKDFLSGGGFNRQIQSFISHAHVFLPIITEESSNRGWVHQEIGFAAAHNIPVLPLAVGHLPDAMIQQLHAVTYDGLSRNLEEVLKTELVEEKLNALVKSFELPKYALYQCAAEAEDRAEMMTQYADDVRGLGFYGLLRQKGGLSSMHIPDKTLGHKVWQKRYGSFPKGPHHCRLIRGERISLESHARSAGCRLIVNPYLTYDRYGPEARRVRLGTLVEFLESMGDKPPGFCQIAFNSRMGVDQSITMVGDWFCAEAITASLALGYRHTILTRHAPSVARKIEDFDSEFLECLGEYGWTPENSRSGAIALIKSLIEEIDAGWEVPLPD